MSHPRHWSLGAKLALVGAPFLLLAVLSIALTLWVSWQLDGGAAAVNEAGRMRMQAYRMSMAVGTGETVVLPQFATEFERSLDLLRHGDLERPLFVPWDDGIHRRFAVVERDWEQFHSPKNLACALSVEAAELLEHFQWMTEEQSRAPDDAQRAEIAHEAADVLLYLIQLADQLGIDLLAAADRKMTLNAAKHPIAGARDDSRKPHG